MIRAGTTDEPQDQRIMGRNTATQASGVMRARPPPALLDPSRTRSTAIPLSTWHIPGASTAGACAGAGAGDPQGLFEFEPQSSGSLSSTVRWDTADFSPGMPSPRRGQVRVRRVRHHLSAIWCWHDCVPLGARCRSIAQVRTVLRRARLGGKHHRRVQARNRQSRRRHWPAVWRGCTIPVDPPVDPCSLSISTHLRPVLPMFAPSQPISSHPKCRW